MRWKLLGLLALAVAPVPAMAQDCPQEAEVFEYETRGRGGWSGEFRLTDGGWIERNRDGVRKWERVPSDNPCIITLVDGTAVIEIHQANLSIYFTDSSDRHYRRTRNLYRITGFE